MATDFFERHDAARRRTYQLVVYFVLAILALIALVYALVLAIGLFGAGQPASWWQPGILLVVAAGVGIVVGGSSAFKVAQLASGGQTVALMMGGVEIPGTTTNARQKRLLNVVEEMAIASGVPVPPVYILDEPGINAFAAGYSPSDAVVAVSRGCLEYLTRDELQGVVAHEFSHILNGDMKLNIRLIGLIFGIMVLSIVGRIIMQSSDSGSSRDRKDSRGGMVLLGLGLFALGLVGEFFGRLIQAAVSRQREYLADASAVQFTRNPEGIAGALKKIGGLQEGGHIHNPRAGEVAHMFFASALRGLSGLLDTHPPLDDRIRRLDPTFNGEYPEVQPIAVEQDELEKPRPSRAAPTSALPKIPGLPQIPVLGIAADEAAARVGRVDPESIRSAQALRADIPVALRNATQEPYSARALIYALLLDRQAEVRDQQLSQLKARAEPPEFNETTRLASLVQSLPDALRLPLLDLAMPALRQMSPRQHQAFRAQVEALVSADQRLSLFEYTLRCVLNRHLDAQFLPQRQTGSAPGSPQKRTDLVARVLSLLAWEGESDPEHAARAFAAGMRGYLDADHPYSLPSRAECSLAAFDAALQALRQATPAVRRRIVVACAACILADQHVTVQEAELLRAICDTLDCPLPPLVVEQAEGS